MFATSLVFPDHPEFGGRYVWRSEFAVTTSLVFQDDQEFDLRVGNISRNVNPHAARLNNMIPAGTRPADREVLTFDSRRNR